jgi:Glycosyl transferase family 2
VGGLAETLPAQQEQQIAAARRLAIVPALNEERSVASVIAEIRELDPDFEILVIDDGSKGGPGDRDTVPWGSHLPGAFRATDRDPAPCGRCLAHRQPANDRSDFRLSRSQ